MTQAIRPQRCVRILGIRGVPAAHGGFETFAEYLALYLVTKGWRVVVYCQEEGEGPITSDTWRGVERVKVPVRARGPLGTVLFDWRTTVHASRQGDLCLTLGYNTAVFCALLRARGVPNVINMDGIEWSRAKWGPVPTAWLWFNERAACRLGNHLVADHPAIKAHLAKQVSAEKITTIAYGADRVTAAPETPVRELGLVPGEYMTLIARPEPENSILEVVAGFSKKRRAKRLLVLGRYDTANDGYHRAVQAAASDEVMFVGAVYDRARVQALRFHSIAYIHGHRVGGTNPSLVEALGAGNAVFAHDNRFNRGVCGDAARYFTDTDDFAAVMDGLATDPGQLGTMSRASVERFESSFGWANILGAYEKLLLAMAKMAPRPV